MVMISDTNRLDSLRIHTGSLLRLHSTQGHFAQALTLRSNPVQQWDVGVACKQQQIMVLGWFYGGFMVILLILW